MLLPQHALSHLQRAPVEWFRFAIAALGVVKGCQIVDAVERVRMLLAQLPLSGLQEAPEERFGLIVRPWTW